MLSAALVLLAPQPGPAAEGAIDGYQDYVAFAAAARALAASPLAKITSLARTRGDREVLLITLARGPAEEKPAILIVGSVHGPHLVGSELTLRIARRLISLAESPDPPADAAPSPQPSAADALGLSPLVARRLLERHTIYLIPRPNPDASEAFFERPRCERAVNDTPTDDDRDGRLNEDPFEDLDGDGWITQLRVLDPAGDYRPHPADPRVLIKVDRARNETGVYRLLTEGIDNDHDEAWNEDPPGGVSLDRNFTFQYPFFKVGAGPSQVSEIESRAIADFAFSRPNIALVFSFGPEDTLIEPWKKGDESGYRKTAPPAADAERLTFLAEQYRALGPIEGTPDSVRGEGSLARWAYFHYGRWSLASRGWWIGPVDPKSANKPKSGGEAKAQEAQKSPAASHDASKQSDEDKRGADDINALAWFTRQRIDGFVDWRSVEHPDFPGQRVEAGGFRPFLRLNPPAAELDPLADRNCAFLVKLPDWLPRLEIDQARVEPLGDGVQRLVVRVINPGYLPTAPAIAASCDHVSPVQIKVEPPAGTTWIAGSQRTRVEPLAGGGGAVEKSWLLRLAPGGPRKIVVTAYAPAVGAASKTVEAP